MKVPIRNKVYSKYGYRSPKACMYSQSVVLKQPLTRSSAMLHNSRDTPEFVVSQTSITSFHIPPLLIDPEHCLLTFPANTPNISTHGQGDRAVDPSAVFDQE